MSNLTINYYKILDITHKASIDDIKKSYRKMVLKYHPDLNKNPIAVRKLHDVIKAYKTLSDPEKRSEYDKNIRNFKVYSGFPDLKKDNNHTKKKNKPAEKSEENKQNNLFSKIKIGFKIFRSKIVNKFNKPTELILADKKLLKIPIDELKERFYTSENKYVRCEALKAIAVILKKKAFPEIDKGFYDISKDVRLVSIRAVGFLNIRQGLKNLEKLYSTSGNTIRRAIVLSASNINNERSKRIIINACQDRECEIKLEALKSFRRMNMGEYINKISYLVYDRNEEVRKLARELYDMYRDIK